jgi:hypothetical protein
MGGRKRLFPNVIRAMTLLLLCTPLARAHHGGLGIEGDMIEWSLKVDQWQQETFANGHRIKFLAYPRNAIVNRPIRLVFEVQSTTTGQYIGGLTPKVIMRTPLGHEETLQAPETPGVTAYYEIPYRFQQTGMYIITFRTFRTHTDGPELTASFVQPVSANPLFGDWPTILGNGAMLAAFMATWIGAILALQRRLSPDTW